MEYFVFQSLVGHSERLFQYPQNLPQHLLKSPCLLCFFSFWIFLFSPLFLIFFFLSTLYPLIFFTNLGIKKKKDAYIVLKFASRYDRSSLLPY